jgi:Prokaryotic N-terminal methylation motif
LSSNSRAGFTLIEILAGLFVTGLFVAAVMPLMTQLVSHAWSGEASMAGADEWMRADARLSSDFSEAIPLSKGNGDNSLIFSATPTRVEFVRRSITGDHRRLDLVTIEIESESQGDSVFRRTRPLGSSSTDDDTDGAETSSNIRILTTSCNLHFSVPGGLPDESTGIKHLPREIILEAEDCVRTPDIPLVFPIVARSNPVLAASAAQR